MIPFISAESGSGSRSALVHFMPFDVVNYELNLSSSRGCFPSSHYKAELLTAI
jgi:hypothetical protein